MFKLLSVSLRCYLIGVIGILGGGKLEVKFCYCGNYYVFLIYDFCKYGKVYDYCDDVVKLWKVVRRRVSVEGLEVDKVEIILGLRRMLLGSIKFESFVVVKRDVLVVKKKICVFVNLEIFSVKGGSEMVRFVDGLSVRSNDKFWK